jgi:aspartate aminotransferase
MFLADRMSLIKPSPTIALSSKVRQLKASGEKIFDFSVGEPDINTPDFVKDATKMALDQNKTRYTNVDGTPELRQAIAKKLKNENNLEYDQTEIIVGTGAKQVIFNAICATVEKGDEVVIPCPAWVSYVDIVALFGGTPVTFMTKPTNNFKPKYEELKKYVNKKTKWLIINSPNNPTGGVYNEDDYKEIIKIMHEFPNLNLMSDDIYEHMIYDGKKFLNILNVDSSLRDRVLIINGVSKSYCMTGFRIGYGAGNKALISAMSMIQSQSTSNASSISQEAARVALSQESNFISEMKTVFQEKRDTAFEELSKIPNIEVYQSEGAFYAFCDISMLIDNKYNDIAIDSDVTFCNLCLEHAKVAIVPGSAFGFANTFRLSFATDLKTIKDGINAIHDFVKQINVGVIG